MAAEDLTLCRDFERDKIIAVITEPSQAWFSYSSYKWCWDVDHQTAACWVLSQDTSVSILMLGYILLYIHTIHHKNSRDREWTSQSFLSLTLHLPVWTVRGYGPWALMHSEQERNFFTSCSKAHLSSLTHISHLTPHLSNIQASFIAIYLYL